MMLGCIHFTGLKWQRNPACSFPACLTSVCPRLSLCCRRRSRDQTCTVLLPLLCFVLPVSLGAGWRGEGSLPNFNSRAWWKKGHGFQQAGDSQASSWLVLTLGLELCWWTPSPWWLICLVDAKTRECIWGRQHDGCESAWLAWAGNTMGSSLGLRENESGGVAFTGFFNRGNWSKISTAFILPSCYLN